VRSANAGLRWPFRPRPLKESPGLRHGAYHFWTSLFVAELFRQIRSGCTKASCRCRVPRFILAAYGRALGFCFVAFLRLHSRHESFSVETPDARSDFAHEGSVRFAYPFCGSPRNKANRSRTDPPRFELKFRVLSAVVVRSQNCERFLRPASAGVGYQKDSLRLTVPSASHLRLSRSAAAKSPFKAIDPRNPLIVVRAKKPRQRLGGLRGCGVPLSERHRRSDGGREGEAAPAVRLANQEQLATFHSPPNE
jgi:hypothetical protein